MRPYIPAEASTVHRALGYQLNAPTRLRHHRDNPLPADIVVVDEASMVDLGLMACRAWRRAQSGVRGARAGALRPARHGASGREADVAHHDDNEVAIAALRRTKAADADGVYPLYSGPGREVIADDDPRTQVVTL